MSSLKEKLEKIKEIIDSIGENEKESAGDGLNSFFDSLDEFWNNITKPNSEKPDGNLTFDDNGDIVETYPEDENCEEKEEAVEDEAVVDEPVPETANTVVETPVDPAPVVDANTVAPAIANSVANT